MVLRGDERGVAVENDDEIVGRQRFARDHQGVSGAALLLLQHESNAGSGNRAANPVGFMSDDGEHVAGRNHFGRGCDHVGQKRLAADFMQHFGMFGLQPRPFAGCQDGNRDLRDARLVVICFRHSIQYTARALCQAGLP